MEGKPPAIVTIEGVTVVLDRVSTIGEICQLGIQFGWDIEAGGNSRTTFKFRNASEAKAAREEFVQALTDWWAARFSG